MSTLCRLPTRSFSQANIELPFSSIPGPKPFPIVGNIWRYLPLIGHYKPDSLYENAQYNRERYGKIVREEITKSLTVLHLFDPDDIESYFRTDTKWPHRRSHRALLKYRQSKPDLYRDGGLFPENGPNWFRQRMQFQQGLMSKSGVASNLHKMDHVTSRTLERIDLDLRSSEDSLVRSFDVHIHRWALFNALSIFLNVDIEHLDDKLVDRIISQLHKSLDALDGTEIRSAKWIDEPTKCPHYRRLIDAESFLYGFVSEVLDKHLSSRELDKNSYLYQWVQVQKIDKLDVVTFCIDSLMAGLHTSSYTAMLFLYHLAHNPTFQIQIRESLRRHSISDEALSIDKIDSVKILKYCLKESMRLSPVSIGSGRLASTDNIRVRNYKIEKGTMVIAHNQIIGRDPLVYEEPDKFKPERWVQYRTKPRHERPSSYALLPFGFGPRVCIGQRLSDLQLRVLIARLVQRFHVTMSEKLPTKTKMIHVLDGRVDVKLERLK